jgi:hypothetical protein
MKKTTYRECDGMDDGSQVCDGIDMLLETPDDDDSEQE